MPALCRISAARAALLVWAAFTSALYAETAQAADGDAARGEYVFNLAGCEGCHTDKKGEGARLAGGRAFKTDYGTFYSPNITPNPATGIGAWSYDNFKTAMRKGEAPDGSNFFPAFPYTSYTHMTDLDLSDLWAYLKIQPAVVRKNTPHDLDAPYGWRWGVTFWNWLYLDQGPKPDWNRGRYLAEALSHCHECHTPRNFIGGYVADMAYAGTPRNPEGLEVPNITPHKDTGIGKWSDGDLNMLFTIGMLPDGDFVGGAMAESISHSTSKMTEDDRKALIAYLRGLKPVENKIGRKKAKNSADEGW